MTYFASELAPLYEKVVIWLLEDPQRNTISEHFGVEGLEKRGISTSIDESSTRKILICFCPNIEWSI